MAYEIVLGRSSDKREKYGIAGSIFMGKHYIQMGQTKSLANDVYMDVSSPHVILIPGKRGCLPGDHRIFTNQGYKEIKDFDENEDEVLSFNKNEVGFAWTRAKLLNYDIENESLVKLTLKDGRVITMTNEHPLLVYYKDAVLVWRKGKDIKEGDLLVNATVLPEIKKDSESLRIARLLGFVLADGTMSIRKGRWKDGRGYWYTGTKKRLRIDSGKLSCLQAKDDIEKEFDAIARFELRKDCNCYHVEAHHSKVIDKFVDLGVPLGEKSSIIRVPKIIWKSSNEFKANFIKALFSCDGFVDKEGIRVEYYSNSRKFLEDLQLLLSHFSIESVIRDKRRTDMPNYITYRLGFSDYASIINYKEKIGFFDDEKERRLQLRKFNLVRRRKRIKYIGDDLACIEVEKVEKVNDINKVYDLEVPDTHSFLANGIISHNSGKSYTLGVIAEGLVGLPEEVSENLACLIFDTMGIYWTMRYPNYRDDKILKEWNLKPKKLEPVVFVPKGLAKDYEKRGVRFEENFSIKPSEVGVDQWSKLFEINLNTEEGLLLERAVKDSESISEIIKSISSDKKSSEQSKMLLTSKFETADSWGIFDEKGTPLTDLFKGGQTAVLDLSAYTQIDRGSEIKALVIGLICDKMLKVRLLARKEEEASMIEEGAYLTEKEVFAGQKSPMVWILIDEAHEFIPSNKKTLASDPIIQILREGRQPGLTLVLATQQPGSIAMDALTQADIVLSHRLTAKIDIDALGDVMQSYLPSELKSYIKGLPSFKGSAVVLDDKLERIYPLQIRPRMSWHGGAEPSALSASVIKRLSKE